jgi:diguanylate cyclase (GGDEF)-like protein
VTSNPAAAVELPATGPSRRDEAPWRAVARVVGPASVLTLVLPSVLLRSGSTVDAGWVAAAVSTAHSALAFLAAATILRNALRSEGRPRLAWTLIGIGTALWGLSNTMWLVGFAAGTNPAGMRSIPAFTITNSVLLAGAVLLPASARRVARIRRIDTAIMMVAAASVMWVLPLDELLGDAAARHDRLIFGALCAVKVLTAVVAMGAFVRCRPDARNEIPPLAFALLLLGIGDVLFVSAERAGYPVMTRVADAFFTSTLLLLLVAGLRLAAPQVPQRARRPRRLLGPALPELCMVLALVLLALDRQLVQDDSLGVSVVLASTLVLLAIFRLGFLEYEQRQLMSSMRSSAERLYREARVDALTGLGNRLALDERLARAARRRRDGALTVFFIDVDHFKRFNDGLGHHAGDRLLVEVARRLRDVLGEDGVHRVGGDEFVAVRSGLDPRSLEVMADDVVAIAAEPIEVDGHELNCTVSVGVAQLSAAEMALMVADVAPPVEGPGPDGELRHEPPARPAFADQLLRRADLALYGAKERGRNQWAAYEPSLQHHADERLRRQQQLHRGLERGELEVHHQPIVHLATGRVVALSAALRWRSPDHGLLPAETFIEEVIDGGMLPHVGTVLFDGIGRTLRQVDEAGIPIEWISTPLRRGEIVHPGFVECLTDAIGEHQVELGRVRLAVAEDTVVDQAALDVITELRGLGVEVIVHHFGTGPSSLLSLGRYPASTITIDESFVEGLGRRRDDTLIVTAVAGLTADLGMELAAAGVVEDFQVQVLRDLGCTLGQGRLFGEHATLHQVLPELAERGAGQEPARLPRAVVGR